MPVGRAAPRLDYSRIGRLLIVKLSSIGDVVHALPAACALRRRYPSARITWLVEEPAAPLLVGHPAIDRVVTAPAIRSAGDLRRRAGDLARAIAQLRSEPYDVALDLQGLLRSSILATLSRATMRVGTPYQREGAGWVSYGVAGLPGRAHAVEENLSVAAFLDAPVEPVCFGLQASRDAAQSVTRTLAANGVDGAFPLIVINPSASAPWKSWAASRWAEVAEGLSREGTTVLVGGGEHRRRHAALARSARGLVDLTGHTTLSELVALLDRCAVHIAPDTASAHIAAALGRPVVSLYGPTAPRRLAPWGQGDRAVYHGELCGRGCPRLCWRRRCLAAATPAELVERARAALHAAPQPGEPAPGRT